MDLYYFPASPACRIVQLTAKALDIELNLKLMDVMVGEHYEPWFVRINPQHMIPTLVDGCFAIWESRAIATYLVEKYDKYNELYPEDLKMRSTINQCLYFDMGSLYKSFCDYYYSIYFDGKKADPEKFRIIEKNMQIFDTLLEGHEYAVGDHLTLADFSLIASTSTFEPTGFDFSKYPNVARWMQKCKENVLGYDEINQPGVDAFAQLIHPTSSE